MKLKIIIGLGLVCIAFIISCQTDDQLEFNRYYSNGRTIYQSKCQNCHGAKGEGLLALIPPLTDSVYLKSHKDSLACIIKYGLSKYINVSGRSFEGQMPVNDLPSVEIASALTYITNSFGNKMGTITSQQVDSDLSGCR
jgi:mono/diheme cytochrome c family protein